MGVIDWKVINQFEFVYTTYFNVFIIHCAVLLCQIVIFGDKVILEYPVER